MTHARYGWSSYEFPANTWVDFNAYNTGDRNFVWHSQGSTRGGGGHFSGATTVTNDGNVFSPQGTVCAFLFKAGAPSPVLLNKTCVSIG